MTEINGTPSLGEITRRLETLQKNVSEGFHDIGKRLKELPSGFVSKEVWGIEKDALESTQASDVKNLNDQLTRLRRLGYFLCSVIVTMAASGLGYVASQFH